jgi:ribosomal protein S11
MIARYAISSCRFVSQPDTGSIARNTRGVPGMNRQVKGVAMQLSHLAWKRAITLLPWALAVAAVGGGCGAPNSSLPAVAVPHLTDYIYVVDSGNNRIVRMDVTNGPDSAANTATFLGGTAAGSGERQFNHPTAIATVDGQFYITDTGNNRIVRIDDITGKNWTTLGTAGSGANQFNQPHGISLVQGRLVGDPPQIFVADTGNNRIVTMDDMTGKNWVAFGSHGSGVGQFDGPYGLDWGITTNKTSEDFTFFIYVSDQNNHRIARFDGEHMSANGWKYYTAPSIVTPALIHGPGDTSTSSVSGLSTADTGTNKVTFFNVAHNGDLSDYTPDPKYPLPSNLSGPTDYSNGIAADTNNNRLVGTIYVSKTGSQPFVVGSQGSGRGQFNHPTAITGGFDVHGNGEVNVH